MKKLFLLLAVIALAASAATVNPCSSYTGQSVLSAGFACSEAGLTFSNFSAVDAGNNPYVQMYLVSAGVDAGGSALLEFNPYLTNASGGNVQGTHFYFQVTNGVSGINLTVDGAMASVNELVCAGPIVQNICGSSTTLANLVAGSGSSVAATFNTTSPIYIYKDIAVTSTSTQAGHLTSFFQSFTPGAAGGGGAAVPEPASLLTLGSGLVFTALLLKRRIRKG